MTLTQANAIEEVRVRVDETSPGFFRDSDLRRFINEGVREVARRTEWKRASTTIAAVAGTQTYVMGTDIIEVSRVEFQPTGTSLKYPLEYRDLNQMDVVWGIHQSVSTGQPAFWTMWSANPYTLYIAPIPAQSGTLNVFYYSMPTDLATTTTAAASTALDVPMGWEDLVVEYATGLAFRKSRRAQDYALAMASFSDKLKDFMGATRRGTDAATSIQPDYFGGGGGYDPYGY